MAGQQCELAVNNDRPQRNSINLTNNNDTEEQPWQTTPCIVQKPTVRDPCGRLLGIHHILHVFERTVSKTALERQRHLHPMMPYVMTHWCAGGPQISVSPSGVMWGGQVIKYWNWCRFIRERVAWGETCNGRLLPLPDNWWGCTAFLSHKGWFKAGKTWRETYKNTAQLMKLIYDWLPHAQPEN